MWPAASAHFAHRVPRADNARAESWAIIALDESSTTQVWHREGCTAFFNSLLEGSTGEFIVVGNFDGACRGNPGISSCGGVLRYVHVEAHGTQLSELFLWEGCKSLGWGTSYSAEVSGARFVLEALFQLLVDTLNEVAEDSVWAHAS